MENYKWDITISVEVVMKEPGVFDVTVSNDTGDADTVTKDFFTFKTHPAGEENYDDLVKDPTASWMRKGVLDELARVLDAE